MPTPDQIVHPAVDEPAGADPFVGGHRPDTHIEVVEYDPAWPEVFAGLADRLREALGARVLDLQHVGSTAVPGLPAKPVIDLDLIVADPAAEVVWLPAVEAAGFRLVVREPWWQEHRCLRVDRPRANVHVFGPDAAEPHRHRIFRDHLRREPADREAYALAKRAAAAQTRAQGGDVQAYNTAKEPVIQQIYDRAFRAAGLLG